MIFQGVTFVCSLTGNVAGRGVIRSIEKRLLTGFSKQFLKTDRKEALDIAAKDTLKSQVDTLAGKYDIKLDGPDEDGIFSPGSVCGVNSFSADMLVATDSGEKAISDLKIGDHVLAYNESQGTTGYYIVTVVLINLDPATENFTIDGETVHTSPHHPFFTEDKGWVDAGNLKLGEKVRKADGSDGAVQALVIVDQPQKMYNLTVDVRHEVAPDE